MRKGIKGIAQKAQRADRKLRRDIQRARDGAVGAPSITPVTADSFQNFLAGLGMGTDNLNSGAMYGLNPISKVRTQIEWIHRGTWIGGVAVDLVADDMTRAGIDLKGVKPEDIEKLNEAANGWGIWNSINETIRWARLYGGCIGVYLIDGQDVSTPFRVDTVGKGQFRGILPLDRWMVEPDLSNLVQEMGPYLGMPKYYRVLAQTQALSGMKIHYTRCMRLIGVKLPYWQAIMENLWGLSVYERLYDRLIAFDSATTGAAQLLHKAYLRILKIKDLRELVSTGGQQMNGLMNYVDNMRRFQTIEGLTLLDMEDEFEGLNGAGQSFSGISDALLQFGQQLAGALQIPLVRLFGQSPAGLNATGESDLRMYYDNINKEQESTLRTPVTTTFRCLAQSEGIHLPDGFGLVFNPLWQMTEKEKADTAKSVADTVQEVEGAGIVDRATALRELKQSSSATGIWTSITDDMIDEAEAEGPPSPEDVPEGGEGEEPGEVEERRPVAARVAREKAKDSVAKVAWHHGLQTVIENPAGTIRRGPGWQVTMPADYGYIRKTRGADGDQVDCYIGPAPESDRVFLIDQKNWRTGQFDEHKVMLGYYSPDTAKEDYILGYTDGHGPDRIMKFTELSMPAFVKWLETADLTRPYNG